MTSEDAILSEMPGLIYIKEQDLRLINEIRPYFAQAGDLFVIIAREINPKRGINSGDLRAGIIRIPDLNDPSNFELVLPFSKRLIHARIKDGIVRLGYVEECSLKTKSIPLDSSGKLNFEDYAFLLDDEIDIIKSNMRQYVPKRQKATAT